MIPDYQTIMLPLLQITGDNKVHKFREVIESLAEHFKLTEEEKKELLPSGNQAIFDNRVGWARFYLTKAGLLKSEKRGTHQVTEEGLRFLKSHPTALRTKDLNNFKVFRDFKDSIDKKNQANTKESVIKDIEETGETPEEALEYAYLK